MLPGQLPQAEQIFRRGDEDAAFALDAFDLHRDGLRRDGGLDRGEIVEGHVDEARQQRLEAVLDFVLPGGGERRHGPAMKRIRAR